MNLIENLKWRYAAKAYNNIKVAEEKVDQILEAINLSASSCGLQSYRVFVVSNPEIQKKIGADSYNKQISSCSHLLVFAAFNDMSSTYIDNYIAMTEKQRGLDAGALLGFRNGLHAYFGAIDAEQKAIWASKQAYIALGTALIAAAELKVDATPIEGFNAAIIDKVLGLKEKGLHSTVILALGYRDSEKDYMAATKKVRLPIDEMITKVY
ncbi:nitroreductase family protein [Flavobacterium quisquiliarum]|uniref:Nitroreductase family protein n=1 Tax=Flavobacterium quisquiliarum TaxID=1834436 RepID=A0ABV8VZM7_9FLAO|nr:nitroreductase family protein [Flavobacterium quisquiliarum]MBW1654540.1 NAD(P)H-dependent oxidoreductase [Flavobacterium quisquiliarum]NWL01775.1 NAD(P)H-dependent oxidoreductase [Flavobacterium collinsii]